MHSTEAVLRAVRALQKAHEQGALGGEVMPEDVLVGVIDESELLDTISLGMALNYQRNSYALWRSIVETWEDPDTRWVFSPSMVVARSEDDLRRALLKYKTALQPNKHIATWSRLAYTVHSHFGGSFRGLVDVSGLSVLHARTLVKETYKGQFPYFSGPKIFNYWAYVVSSYCDVKWLDRAEISVAPDTHIIRASVRLGLCPASVLDGVEASRLEVAAAWQLALDGSGISPIDVHTPLWLWSRAGFPKLGTDVDSLGARWRDTEPMLFNEK